MEASTKKHEHLSLRHAITFVLLHKVFNQIVEDGQDGYLAYERRFLPLMKQIDKSLAFRGYPQKPLLGADG